MLPSKTISILLSGYLPRLRPLQEKFIFHPIARLSPVSSDFVRFVKHGHSIFSTTTTEARRHAGSSTMDRKVNDAPLSASSLSSSPIQQIYKSSHRGRGGGPMLKTSSPNPPKSEARSTHATPSMEIVPSRSACSADSGPVAERPLTPLQKRQLLFKDKAAFVLTPQALRRLKYLISQYKDHNEPSPATPTGKTLKEGGKSNSLTEKPAGIRIGVRRRGCSGYSYTVNYYFPNRDEDGAQKDLNLSAKSSVKQKALGGGLGDVTVEQEGVKVVVDGNALFYVLGTEMDYVVRNVEEKFTFRNPNQKYSCGCEESFMPFSEDDLDED